MRKLKSLLSLTAVLLLLQPLVASAELPEFTRLVEQASPAVVNISTTQKAESQRAAVGVPQMPDLEGLPPMFREFFERMPQMQPPPGQERQPDAQSLGSGFIISADGYVLTNNHVVAGADEIMVRLSDRSELEAKLIGADPRTDVALLKVDGKNLPTVKLGNSENVKVGEWVLAIGSPFGFDHSATSGIVSAKGRSLPNENYVPFIQTDVAINPGNSGGPLFNLDGEVIGINSQIFTRSGGFMGLSFAIPINVAMNVADQLKAEGKVSRGWLGVMIQEVNKGLAESFGLDKPAGALIAQVLEDGPAARGGIKVGDVILEVNGQPVILASDLPHLVGALKPGDQARLLILREGKRQQLSLAVGSLPAESEEPVVASAAAPEQSGNRLGVVVVALSAEQRTELDIQSGVMVKAVVDGPAAMIGLRPGDVITHLNNQPITSPEQFGKSAARLPANARGRLLFCRQGRAGSFPFNLAR